MNFDELYKEYYNLACSIARKFVNPNDVEDAVAEAFIRVWRYRDTIKDERKIFFFLYSIFRNSSINYSKSQSIRPLSRYEELPEDLDSGFTLDDWYAEAEKSLSACDELVKEISLLKLQGYSQNEVSAKLGVGRKQFYDLWAQGKKHLVDNL